LALTQVEDTTRGRTSKNWFRKGRRRQIFNEKRRKKNYSTPNIDSGDLFLNNPRGKRHWGGGRACDKSSPWKNRGPMQMDATVAPWGHAINKRSRGRQKTTDRGQQRPNPSNPDKPAVTRGVVGPRGEETITTAEIALMKIKSVRRTLTLRGRLHGRGGGRATRHQRKVSGERENHLGTDRSFLFLTSAESTKSWGINLQQEEI